MPTNPKHIKDIPIGVPCWAQRFDRLGAPSSVIRLDHNTWAWLTNSGNDITHVFELQEWSNEVEIVDWFEDEELYKFSGLQYGQMQQTNTPQSMADDVCKKNCPDILNGHSPGCYYYKP